MNLRKNLHAADGSFLGFLFQIERVIMWLSQLGPGAIVGVEVDDDIVIKLSQGLGIKDIYEQAKHTIGKTAPYSNKSEDLWKTLSIWVDAVLSGKVNPKLSMFSLLSNVPLPSNRLAVRLSKASKDDDDELVACCDELKKIAKTLRKDLVPFGSIILSCSDNVLKEIISQIVVLDPTYSHTPKEYSAFIKSHLHLSDDLPYDHIMDLLFGHVSRLLIESWRDKKEGWLDVSAFNKIYTSLIAEFKKKPFVERAADSIQISKDDIGKSKGKKFVNQLKAIDCSDDEILSAIHDYIRSLSERSRFAKDGEIPSGKFETYYSDLANQWQLISAPRFKHANKSQLIKVGYEVYYEVLRYKGKLNNYEPEQPYTYKGAYHHLSNELKIGWHPDWEKAFKTT